MAGQHPDPIQTPLWWHSPQQRLGAHCHTLLLPPPVSPLKVTVRALCTGGGLYRNVIGVKVNADVYVYVWFFFTLISFVSRRIGLSYFRVVAGLNTLSSPGNYAQVRSIRGVKMHDGYNIFTSDNDVTLLLLSSPFKFTNYIQPICLPGDVIHEAMLNLSHCFVSGWGSTYYKGGKGLSYYFKIRKISI